MVELSSVLTNLYAILRTRGAASTFVCALIALVACAAACRPRDQLDSARAELELNDHEAPEAIEGLTAEMLLREMVFAYANAKDYSDAGYLEALYERNGEPETLSYRENCALKFAKPNFARLELHDAVIQFDGQRARAEIRNDDYARQALETPAPFVLTSVKEFYPDPKFAEAAELCAPPNLFWTSPQLILLLAKDPLKTLAPPGAKMRLLQPAYLTYTERPGPSKRLLCDRAQVVTEDGERIYWIERETKALARCELSPEGVPAPEQGARVVSVRLEFPEQTLAPTSAHDLQAFKLVDTDDSVRVVDHFISPELDALDRTWPNDALLRDENDEIFQLTEGVTTALCFWSQDDPNWQRALQTFEDGAQSCQDVNFVAVNLDSTLPGADARVAANAAGLTRPLARLDRAALLRADREFPIISSSSFLILDGARRVRRYLREYVSGAQLRRAVARAQENADSAAEDYYAQNVIASQFNAFLEDAEAQDLYRTARTVRRESAPPPKSNPRTFDLREVWRLDNLPGACNPLARASLACGASADEPNAAPLGDVVALPCEGNAIAVVSSQGALVTKLTPSAGFDEPINFLRAIDFGSCQRYYVASGSMESRKLHRFNERFVDLGSLDAGKIARLWIGDAQLADANEDGVPELFVGALADRSAGVGAPGGLYAINMSDLKILWKDETVLSPYCLAVTRARLNAADRTLVLVADRRSDMRGAVVCYDALTGERVDHFVISESDNVHCFASSSHTSPEAASVVALVTSRGSADSYLVGYDSSGAELWREVALPIERDVGLSQIVSGDLDGDGYDEWLVVSSAGAIRFYRATGKEFDSAYLGFETTGACVARWGGSSYVIVTSYNSVVAYRVEAKGSRRKL